METEGAKEQWTGAEGGSRGRGGGAKKEARSGVGTARGADSGAAGAGGVSNGGRECWGHEDWQCK